MTTSERTCGEHPFGSKRITFQSCHWGNQDIDHVEFTLPDGYHVFIDVSDDGIHLNCDRSFRVTRTAVNAIDVEVETARGLPVRATLDDIRRLDK